MHFNEIISGKLCSITFGRRFKLDLLSGNVEGSFLGISLMQAAQNVFSNYHLAILGHLSFKWFRMP